MSMAPEKFESDSIEEVNTNLTTKEDLTKEQLEKQLKQQETIQKLKIISQKEHEKDSADADKLLSSPEMS